MNLATPVVIDASWLTALFGGLTILVAALSAAYVKIRGTQLHTQQLVNSHLTDLNNEITELNGMIHDLHQRIADMKK